ncbi:MAG: S8 family serine peptidase [Candidatus Kerfeldbacteria bacterium]|nr:S8 family serine peptidase [Candidatus Kerfeldbacteria bacterium]
MISVRSTVAVVLVGLSLLLLEPNQTRRPADGELWRWRPAGSTTSAALRTIPGLPGVTIDQTSDQLVWTDERGQPHAQPDHRYRALFIPNDPQFNLQWNFLDLKIPAAWDADQVSPRSGGDPRVVVAVLDTGLAYEDYQTFRRAPDLAGVKVWRNPAEVAGDGRDNDGNGFVDDVHGWDFVHRDAHPNDDHGHGTHIVGTIAGSTNNGLAVAGIAFATTIMPLKVLDRQGEGTTSTIAAAVAYAAAAGADIINLSLGSNEDDPLLHRTIQSAAAKGVILIAAAGNDGQRGINYPARYEEVMSVGATQLNRRRAPYSNHGPQLDVVAPGGNLSLDQNNDGQPDGIPQQTCTSRACASFGTYYYSGTSQAAAQVTAVAALLGACGATSGTIVTTLKNTALDLSPAGRDDQYGSGLVNAQAALQSAGCRSTSPPAPSTMSGRSSATTNRQLFSHQPYPYTRPSFRWRGPTGATYQVRWARRGQTASLVTQLATVYEPTISRPGVYDLEVRTVDQRGRTSDRRTFTYRYRPSVLVVGQTSDRPGVRLYQPTPTFIRGWPAGLGSAQVQVVGGALERDGTNRVAVTGQAWGRTIKVLNTQGRRLVTLKPFGDGYRGSIDLAIVRTISQGNWLVAASRSEGSSLVWYRADGQLVRRQQIYERYRGGLELASGDIDGDGNEELVTVMSRGAEVRVYDWRGRRLSGFVPLGQGWSGGLAVTTGDRDGDGHQEIIVTPRTGGGAAPIVLTTLRGVVKASWRLRTGSYRGEMDIEGVDVDGDGFDELVAVPKSGHLFLQQWSLDGVLQRQSNLRSNDRGGSISSLD